tara:strand:- start:259 stop:816 length:558 start_codon:yes stop_codon:yes gene_type:complete
MTSLDENTVKKIFNSYFVPSYVGQLKDVNLILKILVELQKEPSPTATKVVEEIKKSTKNKIKLNESNIKRIRIKAREHNLINYPKVKFEHATSKNKYLKILPVDKYNFPPHVRKGQKVAAQNDKYKVDFKNPQGKSNIPDYLRGVQFYKNKSDAESAIKEKKNFTDTWFKSKKFKNKRKINKIHD